MKDRCKTPPALGGVAALHPLQGERQIPASSPEIGEGSSGRGRPRTRLAKGPVSNRPLPVVIHRLASDQPISLRQVTVPFVRQSRRPSIKRNPHRRAGTRRASASCSSTARTCQAATPGNQSRNWPTVAPLSRFSNRADTGTRVPANVQAPLSLPGRRSTAGHRAQSVMPSPAYHRYVSPLIFRAGETVVHPNSQPAATPPSAIQSCVGAGPRPARLHPPPSSRPLRHPGVPSRDPAPPNNPWRTHASLAPHHRGDSPPSSQRPRPSLRRGGVSDPPAFIPLHHPVPSVIPASPAGTQHLPTPSAHPCLPGTPPPRRLPSVIPASPAGTQHLPTSLVLPAARHRCPRAPQSSDPPSTISACPHPTPRFPASTSSPASATAPFTSA